MSGKSRSADLGRGFKSYWISGPISSLQPTSRVQDIASAVHHLVTTIAVPGLVSTMKAKHVIVISVLHRSKQFTNIEIEIEGMDHGGRFAYNNALDLSGNQ